MSRCPRGSGRLRRCGRLGRSRFFGLNATLPRRSGVHIGSQPFPLPFLFKISRRFIGGRADADDIVAAFARGEAPPLEPPADHDYKAPSLARAEWEHINRVLSDAGGNISEAARRLGIHRRSLQRKLQKYPPNK